MNRSKKSYSYSRFTPNPCRAAQQVHGRCENKPIPYGDMAYVFQCAPDSELDAKFHTGGHFAGYESSNCRRYLAERCARDWDDVCEAIASNTQMSRYPIPDLVPPASTDLNKGQQFLRSVVTERYCTFDGYEGKPELLNPTDPNSPLVHKKVLMNYVNSSVNCSPIRPDDPILETCKKYGGCEGFI